MQSVFPLFTVMLIYALPGLNFGGWIITSVITGSGMLHTNYCKNLIYALPELNFGGWIITSVITGSGMLHTNYCKNNFLRQPWKLTLKCFLIYVDA